MSIHVQAILTDGCGKFWLDEIDIDPPGPGEVLVKVLASGVCHTDFDTMTWGSPLIMGHEGAGVVQAVGAGVTSVIKGDRVLLNWAIPCGQCFQCRRGAENICESKPVVSADRFHHASLPITPSFQLGTMATHALVPFQAVTPIRIEIPFSSAALLGCGVMTGFGSVINVARIERGSSVVVLGVGGVGLSVIQGAAYAGASRIIAIDLNGNRLSIANSFGATDIIQADPADEGLLQAAQQVHKLTLRGADYAFECTAQPSLGSAPLAMVRHGGVAVGVSGIEEAVPFDMNLFHHDKLYINPLYGQCRPSVDFPFLLELYRKGHLKLDEMVTRTYPLHGLSDAFDDMRQGRNAKGVLLPNG